MRQIAKQCREPGDGGVSRWLFRGQATALALFVVYSALPGNQVFIATSHCLLLTATAGSG